MRAESFCYWLQGAFEVFEPETLTKEQIQTIKNHLNLVFKHDIDPKTYPDKEKKDVLVEIHNTGKTFEYQDDRIMC